METVLVASKQWWSLLTSITGRSSKGRPAVPPSAKLADYFSSKLPHSSLLDTPPVLEDCHYSLFRQFRIKKSQVRSVLLSLDVNKSIGDDGLSPQTLKSCAQLLSGPLISLFRKICRQSILPASWKISRITPVFKKVPDPTLLVTVQLLYCRLYHVFLNAYWLHSCDDVLILTSHENSLVL